MVEIKYYITMVKIIVGIWYIIISWKNWSLTKVFLNSVSIDNTRKHVYVY